MALSTVSNGTMNGVWWGGVHNISVRALPMPSIQMPSDAIVRVHVAGICGSDLHYYNGYQGDVPGAIGHEAMGVIEDIGEAVQAFAKGDYVVVPDGVGTGAITNGPEVLTFYGNSELGGGQSPYVRVPFANVNLIPVAPANASLTETQEMDYLFTSDILATAWTALDRAKFYPGDTVAIFGAGPVGLLAAHSAMLRGASKVYAVDRIPARLQLARSIGAIPIDFTASDAVGLEAVNASLQLDPDVVVNSMVAVTGYGGGLGGVGAYVSSSASNPAVPPSATHVTFPAARFFEKKLSYDSGPVDVRVVAPELVQLIAAGKARPSFIVSRVIGVDEAPDAYAAFARHEESKVVIRFS